MKMKDKDKSYMMDIVCKINSQFTITTCGSQPVTTYN